MEWISIKDRLPGINGKAVVVMRHDATPQVAYFISQEDGYYFCIGDDVKQTWEPEFWMTLPEIPESI